MCTVSFVPLKTGYILTSNRDENPNRQTTLPTVLKLENGQRIIRPIDVLKGGTWIAMDDNGRSACLLNGGFVKHIPKKNYRKSRGYMIIDAFEAENFSSYASNTVLDAIEPFTLILIEGNDIIELVWDGVDRHIRLLSQNKPLLWSSSTLYTPKEHALKKAYFLEQLETFGMDKAPILQIHGKDKNTPFILEHPFIKTVSICQLTYDNQKSKIDYFVRHTANTSESAAYIHFR